MGAVVAALTGSAVYGAVATGIVAAVVSIFALEAFATRELVAHGGISWERPRRAANGAPHAGVGGAGAGGAGTGTGDGCGAGGFDGGGFGGGDGGGGGGC